MTFHWHIVIKLWPLTNQFCFCVVFTLVYSSELNTSLTGTWNPFETPNTKQNFWPNGNVSVTNTSHADHFGHAVPVRTNSGYHVLRRIWGHPLIPNFLRISLWNTIFSIELSKPWIHRLTSIHRIWGLCIVSWRKGCSRRPCVASQSCSWDSSVAARQSFAFGNIESFVRFRLVLVTRNKRPPCFLVRCYSSLSNLPISSNPVGLAWSCARPAGPWIIQPSTGVLRFLCEISAVRWNPQLWMWGGIAGNWQTNCCTCVADNTEKLFAQARWGRWQDASFKR